jgi:D-beta-D-heptose 7-phosphate kinase / D-beta-D-heptose 1-phosphate adenosyltransferase
MKRNKTALITGCFDVLHPGHMYLIRSARRLVGKKGSVIVGINSDESVVRLKGPHKPVFHQFARAYQLLSLREVDAVFIFEEDDASCSIDKQKPDFWVKGIEYKNEDMPEKKVCRRVKTKIVYVDDTLFPFSSSKLAKHVPKRY